MSFAAAKGASGRGLSGLIELTYQRDKNSDNASTTKRSSFIQNYKLHYNNFVYSPRLLMYTLEGTFRKEDSTTNSSGSGDTKTKTKNPSYNLRLDILQGTKYPFTVFKEKYEAPSWAIQPDKTIFTKQTIERYGISGSALLGAGVNLRYDYHQDDTKTTTEGQGTDRTQRTVMFGIDKRKDTDFIDLKYTYQHNFERIMNDFEAINKIEASFGKKPSEKTDFNMNTSYENNSSTDITTISSTTNFSYNPSAVFTSNYSLYINHLEVKDQAGDFESFFGNSTYKISEFFTANQNLMLYRSTGDFGNDSIESLNLGLVFLKNLPEGLSFSADTALNGAANQSATSKDKTSASYSIGGRVAKLFQKISTDISGGGSYFHSYSSLGGYSTRYALNSSLTSRFIRNVTLQTSLNYSEEEALGDTVATDTAGTAASFTRSRTLTSDNSLAYLMQIGFKGSLDARVGASFTAGTTPRTFRYTDLNLRYALARNLSLTAGIRLNRESTGDMRSRSGTLSMDYRHRGVLVTLRNELYVEKGGTQGIVKRSTTYLQVSRPF